MDMPTEQYADISDKPAKPRYKVLLADPEPSSRTTVESCLVECGCQVVRAATGRQAARLFEAEAPDAVLLDTALKDTNAHESTLKIRTLASDRFVPILIITSGNDEAGLLRCMEAGADNFCTKPKDLSLLRARVEALLRMIDAFTTVLAQREELARHRLENDREQEAAEKLFANVMQQGSLDAPNIFYLLSPLSIFNGDLLLAAKTPSGRLRVLIGDFTGHGLPAAVGALPTAEIFYGMTRKGFGIADIVQEVNGKLRQILPLHRFLAVAMLDLDEDCTQLAAWNGGIPGIWVCRGSSEQTLIPVPSAHLPLGILEEGRLNTNLQRVSIVPGDRIIACTDGLLETRNPQGEIFGKDRLERCLRAASSRQQQFHRICDAITSFRAGETQSDDITLIEIVCDPDSKDQSEAFDRAQTTPPMAWRFSLEFGADMLRTADPLPIIGRMLVEHQGLSRHWEKLYTVLTELFSNALDHGLLGLDSALKNSATGFSQYYELRETRLNELDSGWIKLSVESKPETSGGGALVIDIEDSGPGFDLAAKTPALANNRGYSGRGISLVRSLCDSLTYDGNGNRSQAIYRWS